MNGNGDQKEVGLEKEAVLVAEPVQPAQEEAKLIGAASLQTKEETKEDIKTDIKAETKSDWKDAFSRTVHETGLVAAKTVAGVGVGAALGIGAVVAIAVAEVTLPALLIIKIFGFAGGGVGFLKGLNKK
jgi:hypothetical protein